MNSWVNNKVGCVLLKEDKAQPFNKGDQRTRTPLRDKEKCTRCGLCYLYCPDAAVRLTGDGFFEVDKDYCKGCGICSRECWFGAISMAEGQ